MVFSSLPFICVFLPVVLILHSVIPSVKVRNIILLIASLIFYAYGEPVCIILMLVCTLINFLFAFGVQNENNALKKVLLALCIVINLSILGFFKYSDMIVSTLNNLFSLNIGMPEVELPIGISFFTFQAMSYTIDAYRGVISIQKNPFKLLLYISFFPQLIAGPIVKYRDICNELDNREISAEKISSGAVRFIVGLSKKVILANSLGVVADNIFSADFSKINIITAWLAAVAFMLQIFYDFSGYSDMAIGLGEMFGFHFKENFNSPYLSESIRDFWRRWHISLSTWFKEYLYIPLGGNRKGKLRTGINRVIVFFCTGLWHGASWTFVVWGLYHGFFLLLETYFPKINKLPKAIRHIYTLLVVCVGFVIFKSDTFTQALYMIKNMFSGFSFETASMSLALEQMTPWFIFILILSVVFIFPFKSMREKLERANNKNIVLAFKYTAIMLLFIICISRISSNTYNPFIYFRF
ncbi:MAG: MBOAT family O-acyltransferase [Acutalibacteraceae bacterium]